MPKQSFALRWKASNRGTLWILEEESRGNLRSERRKISEEDKEGKEGNALIQSEVIGICFKKIVMEVEKK